jgi:pyruvate dehydrogenase E2 component (dihydrolipoamide acetyltransferase)
MTISAIAAATRDLKIRADARRLRPEELDGGTISVSNLGVFGVERFTALLNPPQAAILAVGAAIRQPVVRDEQIEIGTTMALTLTVDHRPLDGSDAARWMKAFIDLLERPVRILR